MKILFLTGSLNQGGAEYQILSLAKLLKENGYQVLNGGSWGGLQYKLK